MVRNLLGWMLESIVAKRARLWIGCLAARHCLVRPALRLLDQPQGAADARKYAIDSCVNAGPEEFAVLYA